MCITKQVMFYGVPLLTIFNTPFEICWNLPNQGIEYTSPALVGAFFTTWATCDVYH